MYQALPVPPDTVHVAMPLRMPRNVSLVPELERCVAARVASRRYQSASELVGVTLRLPQEREPALSLSAAPAANGEPRSRRGTDLA